jgi:hypothetical protein
MFSSVGQNSIYNLWVDFAMTDKEQEKVYILQVLWLLSTTESTFCAAKCQSNASPPCTSTPYQMNCFVILQEESPSYSRKQQQPLQPKIQQQLQQQQQQQQSKPKYCKV